MALVPVGSEGDVQPMLWVAEALAAAGHEPLMLLTPNYAPRAVERRIPWAPVGGPGDFESAVRHPRFWRPWIGPLHVARAVLAAFPAFFEAWKAMPWRPDAVVFTTFGFAAALAAEAAKVPRLAVHLQPAVLFDPRDPPLLAPGLGWLRMLPLPVRAAVFKAIPEALGMLLLPPLNRHRLAWGLPPWRSLLRDAIFGAQAVALLAPPAFAPPSPADPPHLRRLGFPLPAHAPPPPPEITAFAASHGPPVLWTHGSANYDTARFARCALATADLAPCLLIGPEPPAQPMPPRTLHVSHAPFESVLPFCRAIVHHGGIGTTAKALAARTPQLLIPRAHDQPDNAARVARLGVGHTMAYMNLTPSSARAALRGLLQAFPRKAPAISGLAAEAKDCVRLVEELVIRAGKGLSHS